MAKSQKDFNWLGLVFRFLSALVLVFATYNPEGNASYGWSYYHWALSDLLFQLDFSVLKAFVGITLIIAWAVLLRATLRSLGIMGIILATAFFTLFIWLLVDYDLIPADSLRAFTYIIEVIISGVLAIGVSWSHIRRRITGQIDTDDVDPSE